MTTVPAAGRQLVSGRRRFLKTTFAGAAGVCLTGLASAGEAAPGRDPFARENLVAWCIVPFDARKRGPKERAEMLARLRLRRLAYDWRDEHIPQFDEEVETMQAHRIELVAWWFPGSLDATAKKILEVLERHRVRTQLWVTMGDPAPDATAGAAKAAAAADQLRPIAEAAGKIGCEVGLYNHGGWFGEPGNQLAILEKLGLKHVGLVYNFHHGHAQIDQFPRLLRLMQPHLLALNLNGMVKDGETSGRKILTLGQGDQEQAMLQTVLDSGWFGPVGVLCHRTEADAEVALRDNLDGLDRLRQKLKWTKSA